MRCSALASWRLALSFAGACLLLAGLAHAQDQPAAGDELRISGQSAATWTTGELTVFQVEGQVRARLGETELSADAAVIWILPASQRQPDRRPVRIALIGSAAARSPGLERTGDELLINADVRGDVRIDAERRSAEDRSDTQLFQRAQRLVGAATQPTDVGGASAATTRDGATRPAVSRDGPARIRPVDPIAFSAASIQTVATADESMAVVLSGDVKLLQKRANGDVMELQAGEVVLFTTLRNLRQIGDAPAGGVERSIVAAYLERDVRISLLPRDRRQSEQRLAARKVFYDFQTDRAILTEAVFHTLEPTRRIPIVLRAQTLRQLALGQFEATDGQLSTSAFAVPSYAIAAQRIYLRQTDTSDPRLGMRHTFEASNLTFRLDGFPIFWWPWASGSITDRGFPLRRIFLAGGGDFGVGVRTEWGLLETLGLPTSENLDISFKVDYLDERGLGGGINADYQGGFIVPSTREPWAFEGRIRSYVIDDRGADRLGGQRGRITPPDSLRGRAFLEHQHYFPDDWQGQLKLGWVSDATFQEEYFQEEFYTQLPLESSLYLKRQVNTETFSLLLTMQPNALVSTADLLQEQVEVERAPEIGYHRIGDNLGDLLTFTSQNTVSRLHYARSDATLREQGFARVEPGLPSIARTAIDSGQTYRGDFRQEISLPFSVDQFRFMPYLIARYTGYNDSPAGDDQHRFYGGAGLRINTAFQAQDDRFASELFDIHRLRHVIEPELHLFAGFENVPSSDLFIYDQAIDDIHELAGVSLAVRQRWQTKRGGAGRWRSVDFFTLNLEVNYFTRQPSDTELQPTAFRSLFYPSMPEASMARNGANLDAAWRVSDSTIILADASWNFDENRLATAALGIAAQRDAHLSYFLGARYIEPLDSLIATVSLTAEISPRYLAALSYSFDLRRDGARNATASIIRRFDRLLLVVSINHNQIDDETTYSFTLVPEGFRALASTRALSRVMEGE